MKHIIYLVVDNPIPEEGVSVEIAFTTKKEALKWIEQQKYNECMEIWEVIVYDKVEEVEE